jgi:hypothetical protein
MTNHERRKIMRIGHTAPLYESCCYEDMNEFSTCCREIHATVFSMHLVKGTLHPAYE